MRGVPGRAAAAAAAVSCLDGAGVTCAHDEEDAQETGEEDGGAGRGGEWDCEAQTKDLAAELREARRLLARLMESTEKRFEAVAAAIRRMVLAHQASLAAMVMVCEMRVQMAKEWGDRERVGRGVAVAWRAFAATARSLGRAGFEDAESWRRAVGPRVEPLWGWPAGTYARWEGGEPTGVAALRMQAAARRLLAGRLAARRREQLLVAKRRLAAREAEERAKRASRAATAVPYATSSCVASVTADALAACYSAAVDLRRRRLEAGAECRLEAARKLQAREAEVRALRQQKQAGRATAADCAVVGARTRVAQTAVEEPQWLREAGVRVAQSRSAAEKGGFTRPEQDGTAAAGEGDGASGVTSFGGGSCADTAGAESMAVEEEGTTRTRRKKAGARRWETIAARREVGQSG